MNKLLTLILVFLVGCQPDYPPPAGFVEKCYGGSWNKNMNGLTPSYHALLDIKVENWPQLRVDLEEIAQELDSTFFYEDRFPDNDLFIASICSSKGLYIHADKRVWKTSDEWARKRPMDITIFAYRNTLDLNPIIKSVHRSLKEKWGDQLITEHNIKSSLRSGF